MNTLFRISCAAVLLAASGLAHATLLIDSFVANPAATTEAPGGRSILTTVDVGGSDVAISQFGTFGTLQGDGQLKWVIFDTDVGGSAPVFQTAAVAANAGGAQWWDSPVFNFTLLANTTYYMGLMASVQGDNSPFTYEWDFPGTSVTANGLTLRDGINHNAQNFGAPVLQACCGGVLQNIRIFGPQDVPEPGTLVLLGIGAAGLGWRRRLAG